MAQSRFSDWNCLFTLQSNLAYHSNFVLQNFGLAGTVQHFNCVILFVGGVSRSDYEKLYTLFKVQQCTQYCTLTAAAMSAKNWMHMAQIR